MLYMIKEEMAVHCHHCVRLTANRMKLTDIDWKGTDELLAQIEGIDGATYGILLDYLNAYRSWHDFHVWIESNEKSGRLDDHERDRLLGYSAKKDSKRKAIVRWLDTKYPTYGQR